MEQLRDGRWTPLAFFSKAFRDAEKNYSAFDRELLAIHLSLRHFRAFLEGRQFTVFTDHKPITTALNKVSDPWSARQARHLSAVAEFTSDIRHVSGKTNLVADALSRNVPDEFQQSPVPSSASPSLQTRTSTGSPSASPSTQTWTTPGVPSVPPPPQTWTTTASLLQDPQFSASSVTTVEPAATDLVAIATAQQADHELQKFVSSYAGHKHVFGNVKLPDADVSVICELTKQAPHPLVPAELRRPLTLQLHGLAHPGTKSTVRLVAERFFWPDLSRDVRQWAAACVSCQRAKIHRHVRSPLSFISLPGGRFQHIHIDLVGPLPPSRGYSHLLTVVDRYTRWPEAIPLSDTSTASICAALLYNWVARFGVPHLMTSDRGAQFTSSLWTQMSALLGVRLSATTAYHPQANGLVERFHRRLKDALRARLSGPGWFDQLPWVLLGLRTTIKDDLQCSPAELVYGAPVSVPGDCLSTTQQLPVRDQLQQLRETVGRFRPQQTAHHSATPRLVRSCRLVPSLFLCAAMGTNPRSLLPTTAPSRSCSRRTRP